MTLAIATWNVLHRIHAVNWEEPAIVAYPDEAARIAAITTRVVTLGADVVCLQEVSGDQLARLPAHAIAMRYPRVPRYFRPHQRSALPNDPAEYLVTIATGARVVHAEAFASDRGKGFQVIEVGDIVVVNTHVSFGDKHAEQCARIAEAVKDHARVVIVGDFNADRDTCIADLGGTFGGIAPVGLPTRPRTQPGAATYPKSEHIDHVLVRGCTIEEVNVARGDGLSDHNPVIATVSASASGN